MSRAMTRRSGRNRGAVAAGEPQVGRLQRRERGVEVAADTEFLAGDCDQPLDLDQHRFVAPARKVGVQLLERLALALFLGEPRFEHQGPLARGAGLGIRAIGRLGGAGRRLLELTEPPCRLLAQRAEL